MNPLAQLQKDVAARLAEDAFFLRPPGITVLAENRLDIQAEMKAALAKLGMGVTVMTPKLARGDGGPNRVETEGGILRRFLCMVTCSLTICEHVLHNRGSQGTQQTGLDVGWAAIECLEGWPPSDIWTPLFMDNLELHDAREGILYYQVDFTTKSIFTISD